MYAFRVGLRCVGAVTELGPVEEKHRGSGDGAHQPWGSATSPTGSGERADGLSHSGSCATSAAIR